jgi:methionyl-tRNA formyltransferase
VSVPIQPQIVNPQSTIVNPLRLIFFGSGAFGLPTLKRLVLQHEVALVVTQPDRPAGRNRALTPTPIAEFAAKQGISVLKPADVNDRVVVEEIKGSNAEAFVVIAFGQKLGRSLLEDVFAINLHASLLPKFRGAAPINWAMINGERETGVSVIGVAERMDAGPIYAQGATPINPNETAGELHDRLADLGPNAILGVLQKHREGNLIPQYQEERLATRAPKLAKSDGTVQFNQPVEQVRNRIHGLTPWPGCTVSIDGRLLKLLRVQVAAPDSKQIKPGIVSDDLTIGCAVGSIQLLEVQPAGGKVMSFDAYRNGQPVKPGMKVEPHLS